MKFMDTASITISAGQLAALIRELSAQKNIFNAEAGNLTRMSDSILHNMERPGCKYKERARLGTQLARVRRERRVLKDWLRANEPLFEYIGCKKVQNLIESLVSAGECAAERMTHNPN